MVASVLGGVPVPSPSAALPVASQATDSKPAAAPAATAGVDAKGGLANRVRPAAPGLATTVKVVPNGAAASRGAVVHDDGRTQVVDNGDGTRTARIGVVSKSFESDSGRKQVDTALVDVAGRLESTATAEPISIAASTSAADLVTVGRLGRQVRGGSSE